MQGRWVAGLALAAALLGACETNTHNPFETLVETRPPDDDDDLVFTSNNYALEPGLPNDLFSTPEDAAAVNRLTACNRGDRFCHSIEGAVAANRVRAAVRRVVNDTDGDGRLTDADHAGLVVMDLEHNIEATVLEDIWNVNSLDWSPSGDQIIFCATSPGDELEDFFVMESGGSNRQNLTRSPEWRERRARFDPSGRFAAYERIDSSVGKAKIWLHGDSGVPQQLTSGGPGTARLEGTPYIVGSDTDPCVSPDAQRVAFRRLTGIGDGRGTWDILTIGQDGTTAVVASGPSYRGPPDWGPNGIAFEEPDPRAGSRIAIIQPDGSSVTYPVAVGEGYSVAFPRWIPEP